jgi:hypothetical protein
MNSKTTFKSLALFCALLAVLRPTASFAADTPTPLASLASHVLTAAAGNPCAARNVATVSGAVAAMSCVMRAVHAYQKGLLD